MQNNIDVKPEVLQYTRKSLSIDLNDASKLSGISVDRIKELESDQKPSLNELKALAKAYNSSIAALLLYKPLVEKPLPKDRRTVNSEGQGVFDPKTILAIRKARALLASFIELKEELGFSINRFSFSASIDDSPIKLAMTFQKDLRLNQIRKIKSPALALEAYIEKIESIGIVVFQLPLTKDKLRGLSIIDEQLPIIVIKRGSESATAKNFTLFHELGHILLNEGSICDINLQFHQQHIEKWCNAFAGEILVPSSELLANPIVKKYSSTRQKDFQRKDLVEIGISFHVGPLVILRRLLENDLTSKEFYAEKHNVWNKPTFGRAKEPEGRNIPKEVINERGKTYVALALKAFDNNKINLKDLSDYLGVKLKYIPGVRQILYS
jgi:Zn-dependent peptidase ImmA (M78 family)